MKMDIGEHPREFIMRVDSAAKELRRLGKTVDEDDIVVVILNGVSREYDIEVRLPECGDDCFSYHITKVRSTKPKGRSAEEKINHEANEKEGTRNQMRKMKSRCCYVCGETDGHTARNCSQRKGKTEYIGKEGNARTLITKSVHTTSMSAIPGVAVTKSAPEGFEIWIADSGSTEHITPDATALK
ncbi:unnamed protein product [Ascophyllum nodosum]